MFRFVQFVLIFGIAPLVATGETRDEILARATAAVQAATARAQADPAHPIFHVTSPAQWMNDPNGPIFYKGYYHLFYQLHPFSDGSGPKYWGHVRSRDLVKWEHLPIALWPSRDLGEAEVWSGCCTINGRGQPMAFYTSIAPGKSAMTHAEQWAAIGDQDLIHWTKSPANPVLTESLHGEKKIYEWRDPFIFRAGPKIFLVTGGNLNETKGGQAVVNIYEATNPDLTQWTYRGVMFQHPDPEARTIECPNFFKLGTEWVLLVSPYGKVQYFVGDFDEANCRFHPRARGFLDYGPNFYAPNTMQLQDGRRLVWGWVTGFPGGHGWNGCLTLPRQLSLSRDGKLLQEPVPQLGHLRGEPVKWRKLSLEEKPQVLELPGTNTVELLTEIDLEGAKKVNLELAGGNTGSLPIKLGLSSTELSVMDSKAPLNLKEGTRTMRLRIFVDCSVLEVYANDVVCFTKTLSGIGGNATLALSAEGGNARASQIEVWPMKTIW